MGKGVEGDGEELEAARWRERGAAAARDFRVEIWGRGRKFRGREIAEGKYSGSGVPKSRQGEISMKPFPGRASGRGRKGGARNGKDRGEKVPSDPLAEPGSLATARGSLQGRPAGWARAKGPPRWGPRGVP